MLTVEEHAWFRELMEPKRCPTECGKGENIDIHKLHILIHVFPRIPVPHGTSYPCHPILSVLKATFNQIQSERRQMKKNSMIANSAGIGIMLV